MSLHFFIEYLKYKWKAKGRHGIHSPFVYALLEQVLLQASPQPLEKRLEDYFKNYRVICSDIPGQWEELTHKLNNNTILLLADIHKTTLHTRLWEKVCLNPEIKMSIDMYKYGMLLTFDEFKEKQHFVLKFLS